MPASIQPSFAAGEISSALYARVDINAYHLALRTAVNVMIDPTGGAVSRPGTYFVGPCKDHSYAPRLVRWVHQSGNTYWLEAGNQYFRVIVNGGYVLEGAKTVSTITQADPGVVTTTTAHGYSTGDEVYVSGVSVMTEVNQRRFQVGNVTGTATFSLAAQVDGTDFDTTSLGTGSGTGGSVARVYTVTTPWDQDEVWYAAFKATAGVMTVAHPDFATREITSTASASWTVSTPSFVPGTTAPAGVSVSVGSTGSETRIYRVTAVDAMTFEESLAGTDSSATGSITNVTKANPAVVTIAGHPFSDGDVIAISGVVGMTELNDRRFTVAGSDTNTFQLLNENSTNYTAYGSGGTAALTWTKVTNSAATENNTVSWNAVSGAEKYFIYRNDGGIFGFIGETKGLSFLDDNYAPDTTVAPPEYRDPFFGSGNYPAAVGYYQRRRVFGGSDNAVDTSQFSRVNEYRNFSQSDPYKANDAFAAVLPAEEPGRIRHYVRTSRRLLALCENAEWVISYGAATAGFSLDTINQDDATSKGVGSIPPIVLDHKVLAVQKYGRRIYDLSYAFSSDAVEAVDLSVLASHLFQDYGLSDWTSAENPRDLVVAVRSDGVVLCLTYKPEQRVNAFTRWTTKGNFEAAEGGPGTGAVDEVYFVAKRVIGGTTYRFVERLAQRKDKDVQDYHGVDCGVALDTPIAISGVSATDPVVVTTTSAHGLSNGDEIDIEGIVWEPTIGNDYSETQPAQLNKLGPFKVANKTATTFELTDTSDVDIDGTAYNAYVSGGNVRLRVSTVSGLWHLEGRTDVAVLYNGSVALNQTIASGTWTVPNSGKASRIHAGLGYNCDAEMLDVEAQGGGTIQGRRKHIPFVHTRVHRTAGLMAGGPSFANMVPLVQNEGTFTGGTEATLLSKDVKTLLKQRWGVDSGRVSFRQPYPLPMTILAVIPDVSVGGS